MYENVNFVGQPFWAYSWDFAFWALNLAPTWDVFISFSFLKSVTKKLKTWFEKNETLLHFSHFEKLQFSFGKNKAKCKKTLADPRNFFRWIILAAFLF